MRRKRKPKGTRKVLTDEQIEKLEQAMILEQIDQAAATMFARTDRYFTIRTRDGRTFPNNSTDKTGTVLEAMRYLWLLYKRSLEHGDAHDGWQPVSMTYQPKGEI